MYKDCKHVATGLISEVYTMDAVALKVVTETRKVEPHNPAREVRILQQLSHPSIIKLTETFRHEGGLVIVFPYMPLTLAELIAANELKPNEIRSYFEDLFSALEYLHEQDIIHRDIKPSNLLLASASGPAYLADFGTAWHPAFSLPDEPASHKVLEVGTGSYRAPETLFGNRCYGTSLDIWAAGTLLAECLRTPPKPLFESRDASEDGNQLGLILSIFKALGTPTERTWPEALLFSTPPFEWYQEFPGHSWGDLLPGVSVELRELVSSMICYESGKRVTAKRALELLAKGFGT
jgi:cyclin-dependent kinase